MTRIIISAFLLSFMATATPPNEDAASTPHRLSIAAFTQMAQMSPHIYAERFQWTSTLSRVKSGHRSSIRLLTEMPEEVAVEIIALQQEKAVKSALKEVDHVRQPEMRLETWHEDLFGHLTYFGLTPEAYIAHFPMEMMVRTPMIWHTMPKALQQNITGPRWSHSAFVEALYSAENISSAEGYAKKIPWDSIDRWQIQSAAHTRALRRLPLSFATHVLQAHIIQETERFGTQPMALKVEGFKKGTFVRGMLTMHTGAQESPSAKKITRWSEQKFVTLLSVFGLTLKDFVHNMDTFTAEKKPYMWQILPHSVHQEHARHQLRTEVHARADDATIQAAYDKIVVKVRADAKKFLPQDIMDVVLTEDLMRIQFSAEDNEMDRAGKYLRLAVSLHQASHAPVNIFIDRRAEDTPEIIVTKNHAAALAAKKRAVAIAAIKAGALYTRHVIRLSHTQEIIDRLQSGILCYQWAANNLSPQAIGQFTAKLNLCTHVLHAYQQRASAAQSASISTGEDRPAPTHNAPYDTLEEETQAPKSTAAHTPLHTSKPIRSLSVGGNEEDND